MTCLRSFLTGQIIIQDEPYKTGNYKFAYIQCQRCEYELDFTAEVTPQITEPGHNFIACLLENIMMKYKSVDKYLEWFEWWKTNSSILEPPAPMPMIKNILKTTKKKRKKSPDTYQIQRNTSEPPLKTRLRHLVKKDQEKDDPKTPPSPVMK